MLKDMDKIGRCNRCGKNNVKIHFYSWLEPEKVFLCENCVQKWHIIYEDRYNFDKPVYDTFKKFMKGAIKRFDFR